MDHEKCLLKMQNSKKARFHIFYFIIIAMSVFIFVEIFTRLIFTDYDLFELTGRKATSIGKGWKTNDAFCAYRGNPGYVYKNFELKKTINSLGFISTPEITIPKSTDTIRIVFLGGSSTAGIGGPSKIVTAPILDDQETWPWLTMEIMKREIPDRQFDFINASAGGYTSFESFGRLWSRVRFLQPDIIIVYHAWNEMYYFKKEKVDDIINWRTDKNGDWDINSSRIKKIIKPLYWDRFIRHSQLLIRIRLFASKRFNSEIGRIEKSVKLSETYDKRALEIFRKNLQLIEMVSDLIGAKLFVCKQATLIVPDLSIVERRQCRYEYHGFDHNAHVDAFDDIYKVIDEEIDENSIIDATGLSGVSRYFIDHVHPNKIGSQRIAGVVAANLIKWLESDDIY